MIREAGDEPENIWADCDLSFDDLLDAMRDGGSDVERYLISDEGAPIQIAND